MRFPGPYRNIPCKLDGNYWDLLLVTLGSDSHVVLRIAWVQPWDLIHMWYYTYCIGPTLGFESHVVLRIAWVFGALNVPSLDMCLACYNVEAGSSLRTGWCSTSKAARINGAAGFMKLRGKDRPCFRACVRHVSATC